MRRLAVALASLGALGLAATVGLAAVIAGSVEGSAPSQRALSSIPSGYLQLYQAAAETCPGLPWTVLAAIGTIESSNGQSSAAGVKAGANFAGAEGPMQFEPATFASYAVLAPDGADPPSPYDPADAVYTAARMLCANGASNPGSLSSAIFDYNHSQSYVSEVLSLASSYGAAEPGGSQQGSQPAGTDAGGSQSGAAVAFAEAQIGVPYEWGGEGPSGFDCSGLVQAAYASAGISFPRVAQDQYDAGPQVPAGEPLQPGDLVFFGRSPSEVTHVGIYVGNGMMIDAPYTGADVRAEPYGWPDYLGATRPAGT